MLFFNRSFRRAKKFYNFKDIIVSGVEGGNNIASKIIENIFKKQTIKISSNPKNKTKNKIYTYILKKNLKQKKKIFY